MADKHQSIWTLNEVYDLKVNNNWPAYVPPPPVPFIYGWTMGGNGPSTIENGISRLTYASDTTNMSDRSDLSTPRFRQISVTDDVYAWIVGGSASPGLINSIDRLTLDNDTTDAIDRADITIARDQAGPVANGTFGWFAGGINQASGTPVWNVIDRLEFANDTTNALDRSDLTIARGGAGGHSNGTFGWFTGGKGTPGKLNVIDRLTFSSDTTNAVDRADLVAVSAVHGFSTNSDHAWTASGAGPGFNYVNTVQRYTLATDTTNSLDRSDLAPIDKAEIGGSMTDGTYGWYAGGGFPRTNSVYRLDFANDTTNGVDRSDMPYQAYGVCQTNSSSAAIP